MLLIQDSENKFHVFEPSATLSDVAKYVWEEPTLTKYRVIPDEKISEIKEVIFVELSKEKRQRLRNFSEILGDNYYSNEF